MPCHVNKSDIGQTRLEKQWEKNTETTWASLSRFAVEKKLRWKEKKRDSKSLFVMHIHTHTHKHTHTHTHAHTHTHTHTLNSNILL